MSTAEVEAPSRSRGRLARVIAVLGYALLATAAIGVAAHFVSWPLSKLIAVGAFAFYLIAAAPLATVLLLVHRRWAAIAGIGLTLIGMAIEWPLYRGAGSPKDATSIVVMTGNLRLGQADAAALVTSVLRHRVDVLLVQELTPSERLRLGAAGLDTVLPYNITNPSAGAIGVGLWSRFPLADAERHDGLQFAAVSARVLLGAGRPSPTVLTLHVPAPWPQSATGWRADMQRLPSVLSSVAAQADRSGSTVLVGGDFNATYDSAQFRHLLRDGYADAAEQSGAGWAPTYPADSFLPPLIGIDHVLTRNAMARRTTTVSLRGSDHRALLVRVALPPV